VILENIFDRFFVMDVDIVVFVFVLFEHQLMIFLDQVIHFQLIFDLIQQLIIQLHEQQKVMLHQEGIPII
jgi:hypothetical protein